MNHCNHKNEAEKRINEGEKKQTVITSEDAREIPYMDQSK